jgi:N-acetylglucosaminyldiphosphoundecaprenol N-acetyl-beta-D-mannosaminyltransferase
VKPPLKKVSVVNAPVTASPFDEQIKVILEWASKHLSKVVCVANVHMVTEAYLNQDFGKVLKSADLVTPDGMPLVWMMRMLGARNQDRVAGLDILQAICKAAPSTNISLFFVGSETPILDQMRVRLNQEFPNLQIAGMEPLPFRPLTPAEDEALIQKINASGAGVVLVSLGCPKQERWMAEHKDKIHAVMIGLGGAFPVYAGICKRAPRWVREMGMEWFYRLIQEPRRLWKRYSTTIPLFLWLASKQLIKQPKVLLRSQS